MADNKNEATVTEKGKTWFKGLKAEFHKINWSSKEEITKESIAVVVISVVVGIIIAFVDMILRYGIDFLVSL